MDELLLNTNNHYEKYLTYYMKDFVVGENNHSDGLLHQRMKKRTTKLEDDERLKEINGKGQLD